MRVHDLLLQDVGLVEEEYDGGALEPGIGDDGFEQGLALLHTVLELNCSVKKVGTTTPHSKSGAAICCRADLSPRCRTRPEPGRTR